MDPALEALCREVFGSSPDHVESFSPGPGARTRGTQRLVFGERVVYATHRQTPGVTEREAAILTALGKRDAPVPLMLAFQDGWLLVDSAGPERLSQTLAQSPEPRAVSLLRRAIDALAKIHRAGDEAGLDAVVPSYAHGAETAKRLLTTIEAVGVLQGVSLPDFDAPLVGSLLAQPGDAFIKWDARPANAAVDEGGSVRWYDWQHANRRFRADDLVWLLCDEFTPEAAEPARLLVETARAWEGAVERVCALGCAHVAVRLRDILTGAAGLDAEFEACLANDWLGSRESALRLSRRGAAVAREAETTRPLGDYFARIELSLRA